LPELVEGFFFLNPGREKQGRGFDKLSQVGFSERRSQMPGLIALIVAILVFWFVLKAVALIGAVLIGLAAAVAVYFVAEKLLNKAR
jgi:hypothetical protein